MSQYEDASHFQPEWCRVVFRIINEESRQPDLILRAIEDITERRQAEEKLRASEDGIRTLIEQVNDFARVQAYLALSLLLIIRGGLVPSVAFSITPTVG